MIVSRYNQVRSFIHTHHVAVQSLSYSPSAEGGPWMGLSLSLVPHWTCPSNRSHQSAYRSKVQCFPRTQRSCGVRERLEQADGVAVCVRCKASDHTLWKESTTSKNPTEPWIQSSEGLTTRGSQTLTQAESKLVNESGEKRCASPRRNPPP